MRLDRRRFLHAALVATLASAALPAKAGDRPLAALLLPLSGEHADLGRALARAARLAEPGKRLVVLDSGATPASAAAATEVALRRGAPMIFGPIFSTQVAAVVEAAKAVPVIALTNDDSAARFVLGVTPAQSVGAILGYARERGARRIAVLAGASRWDMLAAASVEASRHDLGLEIVAAAQADALLITGDAAALAGAARVHDRLQLLGTCQALDAAVEGAWFAAPDPDAAIDFARRFEAAYGSGPGQLAALAYDAVGIARSIGASGHAPRDALLGSAGFAGITGTVRFAADGRATRDLAIVVVEGGRFRTVAHGSAT